ncbi:hypothetical protein TEU_03405 [Thermococcus eurythermalis]|uniref:Uncharacterized protein n=1 Tax=Thermococcus eurythermalis TaxID=1505907 RepID=A0A097QSK6_9EURY|nr:hypothetical protein [Thermococcus eurythermalis]AIU69468.1 hypothetical protein TEU_03405 [Thermococcus eurythermalis]
MSELNYYVGKMVFDFIKAQYLNREILEQEELVIDLNKISEYCFEDISDKFVYDEAIIHYCGVLIYYKKHTKDNVIVFDVMIDFYKEKKTVTDTISIVLYPRFFDWGEINKYEIKAELYSTTAKTNESFLIVLGDDESAVVEDDIDDDI